MVIGRDLVKTTTGNKFSVKWELDREMKGVRTPFLYREKKF